MREAYDETGSTDKAIELGLARTGKLVTSAALILVFAFLVLSTSPGYEIKPLAIGLAAGIVLDATVIRALLVPALMKLLGDANWWMPSWPRARRYSKRPGLVGEHDGLDAVAQVELLEDVGDVGLDRRVADEQPLGDLGVREALGDQAEDLELARGQLVDRLRRRRARAARELVDHALGDGGGEQRVAGGDRAQRRRSAARAGRP